MLEVDLTELYDLQKQLADIPNNLERNKTIIKGLKKACKPCLALLKERTPDSGMAPYIPKRHAGDKRYQRGGQALKNSARIRATKFKVFGQKQVIVGYSKGKNKAGWRAHFTDQGFTVKTKTGTAKIAGQDWIKPVELATEPVIEKLFELELQKAIDSVFK